MAKFDERDTLFSRMELKEGTEWYVDYYTRHPERKARDDAFRRSQTIFSDDTPLRSMIDATFSLLEKMRPLTRGELSSLRQDIPPEDATRLLQTCAESYGAVLFGAAQLGDACFYSTRGRGDDYGNPVDIPGKQGIVFAVKMSPEEIAEAPNPRAAAEVVNGYMRVAVIGLVLAETIRQWGWNATCTMDGRADVVLPVAARFAGLGSIGRSGLLLTDDFGPCVRLGAVLTDMPLARTPRKPCTASKLCLTCKKCAVLCPAQAIDTAMSENGQFAKVDDDACFTKWKEYGTDCGLCVANCPLTKNAHLI